MNQHTIQSPVTLSGTGLHTGQKVTCTLKPAVAGEGVRFVRIDLPGQPVIKVCPSSAVMDAGVTRCTIVQADSARVSTVEHLLAALGGLSVDNVTIAIDGPEVPGLDGSSLDFAAAIKKAGIVELKSAPQDIFEIREPIIVTHKNAFLAIVPAPEFSVSYTLDYDHPALRSQFFTLSVDPKTFERALAGARTFCLQEEAQEIRAKGLGKGADRHNTLVMGRDGPLDNSLRFPDECARHKVLDIVGDLFLLGYGVRGAVVATKSGHALNRELVKKIDAQRKKYAATAFVPASLPSGGRVFTIDQIQKILPHRYPFLLVDRVIEVEQGKRGIGVKNVTINDGFFQGHFPAKPVMPGVLMVEAMAQTAGVVVLTSGLHSGKVALFMAIEAVKFRKVVSPGDQLLMEVEIIRDRDRTASVKGTGRVDGEIVVEAEMLFSYTDASYLYA
ncbi:MAG: UDP-3-O-acyl-N-acetylglucosamine deacetylase [Candidatus Omnitrophota bacterium]|nr:UDP-3-O-acyl-N-acetylglucosamine deacetylase [Candidatus Omnitrophota bacterium]